ncbi:hypothetical protein HDU92_004042 [Lobulomyces angularis]|nr:hypothetical protein HDU92_004042 [Lobulomyces angularis]
MNFNAIEQLLLNSNSFEFNLQKNLVHSDKQFLFYKIKAIFPISQRISNWIEILGTFQDKLPFITKLKEIVSHINNSQNQLRLQYEGLNNTPASYYFSPESVNFWQINLTYFQQYVENIQICRKINTAEIKNSNPQSSQQQTQSAMQLPPQLQINHLPGQVSTTITNSMPSPVLTPKVAHSYIGNNAGSDKDSPSVNSSTTNSSNSTSSTSSPPVMSSHVHPNTINLLINNGIQPDIIQPPSRYNNTSGIIQPLLQSNSNSQELYLQGSHQLQPQTQQFSHGQIQPQYLQNSQNNQLRNQHFQLSNTASLLQFNNTNLLTGNFRNNNNLSNVTSNSLNTQFQSPLYLFNNNIMQNINNHNTTATTSTTPSNNKSVITSQQGRKVAAKAVKPKKVLQKKLKNAKIQQQQPNDATKSYSVGAESLINSHNQKQINNSIIKSDTLIDANLDNTKKKSISNLSIYSQKFATTELNANTQRSQAASVENQQQLTATIIPLLAQDKPLNFQQDTQKIIKTEKQQLRQQESQNEIQNERQKINNINNDKAIELQNIDKKLFGQDLMLAVDSSTHQLANFGNEKEVNEGFDANDSINTSSQYSSAFEDALYELGSVHENYFPKYSTVDYEKLFDFEFSHNDVVNNYIETNPSNNKNELVESNSGGKKRVPDDNLSSENCKKIK